MSRATADERLRRLLAMVPWVAVQDGPTVEEVCERFGTTEEELAEDLQLLFLCGLYPFTPDTLIEADIADGRVWIEYADYFARPLRLSPAEGLALVAAGAALLGIPGTEQDGPLARGLGKLAAVLGVDVDESIEVELGDASPELLPRLRTAVEQRRLVEIEYYSYGRDDWTTRVIEPYEVFSQAGQWYVIAHDRRVGDRRVFRIDRMRQANVLDEEFPEPAERPERVIYAPREQDSVVVLDLPGSARWVIEQYPYESVEEKPDGRLVVRLRASEKAWLERLLLRLGPDTKVAEGAEGVAASASERVLARYGVSPNGRDRA